jgi:hypothetical protein
MARTDNCLGCFFFDYHRVQTLGVVGFPLTNPTYVNVQGLAAAIFQLQQNNPTFTITIVFSLLKGGTLPSPLQLQAPYYPTVIDLNNFQIAASPTGPPILITTPGSQSGVVADICVMGCHRDAPQSSLASQSGQPARATWQPVDPDYWCGLFKTSYPTF